jgi:hypothetical protein
VKGERWKGRIWWKVEGGRGKVFVNVKVNGGGECKGAGGRWKGFMRRHL